MLAEFQFHSSSNDNFQLSPTPSINLWKGLLVVTCSMVRSFQGTLFHFIVISFCSFSVKLNVENSCFGFLAQRMRYTPLFLLVALRLVKGSDYKVVYYNLFSVSINITLYFHQWINACRISVWYHSLTSTNNHLSTMATFLSRRTVYTLS